MLPILGNATHIGWGELVLGLVSLQQAPGVNDNGDNLPARRRDTVDRVIDLDPHTVGVSSANWSTGLLATYWATATRSTVTAETVRLSLRAAGSVCKRPTWTLKRTAEGQPGYGGNACGWR